MQTAEASGEADRYEAAEETQWTKQRMSPRDNEECTYDSDPESDRSDSDGSEADQETDYRFEEYSEIDSIDDAMGADEKLCGVEGEGSAANQSVDQCHAGCAWLLCSCRS